VNIVCVAQFCCCLTPSPVSDIVDIKPANMEELTEVITAAEFHPSECSLFVYSSSKGTVRLCDMRSQALCDKHAKSKYRFDIQCTSGDSGLLNV